MISKSNEDKYTNHLAHIPLASFSPCKKVTDDESVLMTNFLALKMCSNFLSPKMNANNSPLCAGYFCCAVSRDLEK